MFLKSLKDMLRKVVKKVFDNDGICVLTLTKVFQVAERSEIDELKTWFNSVVDGAKFLPKDSRLYVSFELSEPDKEPSLFDDVY